VVRACIDAEAYRFHTFALATRMQAGEALGPEASLSKIFWSELDVALHETALALLGPEAELDVDEQPGWMKHYQFSLAGPIYAGTNEIQRNVVAERVLGLPRK
jgi:alkylation response protein AidB-like acyl-CoA dehydrogenase